MNERGKATAIEREWRKKERTRMNEKKKVKDKIREKVAKRDEGNGERGRWGERERERVVRRGQKVGSSIRE